MATLLWFLAPRTRWLLQRTPSVHRPFPIFSPQGPSSFSKWSGLWQRKKPSFAPSPEQQKIVELCSAQNVVVSARPGSGKTATAEAIVAAHQDKRVAVFTYSKRLQFETQRRLKPFSNCSVMTFHAMARRLFNVEVNNDTGLWEQRRKLLHSNQCPDWSHAPFDIIILDEFQDCTNIIFWLVNCFIRANNSSKGHPPARLVVLGDERQSIYGFRGADQRFLTRVAELLGPISPYPFAKVSLSKSFRLSSQSVRFINDGFLGGESYINSQKQGPEPIVLVCNPFHTSRLAEKLSTLINKHGAGNSVILAPSVRENRALQWLINALCTKHRIPIAVSTDDEMALDDKVTNGKLCVSTIHQFKGSERDLVITLGIDASYFRFFGRGLPDYCCPNEIFVALTRAVKQLVMVHNIKEKTMPFASAKALHETANVIDLTGKKAVLPSPDAAGQSLERGITPANPVGVRNLTRHLREEPLNQIITSELLIQKFSRLPSSDHIKLDGVVVSDEGRGFYEAVSDINGSVIVAAFEQDMAMLPNAVADQGTAAGMSAAWSQQRVSELCRQMCEAEAIDSGYWPRCIQMKDHAFDWIKPKHLALARSRLQKELNNPAVTGLRFEVEAKQPFEFKTNTIILKGRADIVASSTLDSHDNQSIESVWEIKFVSQLTNEHAVQACLYALMLGPETGPLPRIMLYNVRDGEKWEITPRRGREGLRGMIERVLELKYTAEKEMSLDQFFKLCEQARLDAWKTGGSQ